MIIQEREDNTVIFPFETQENLDSYDAEHQKRILASSAHIDIDKATKGIRVNCGFNGSLSTVLIEDFIWALQNAVRISKIKEK